MAHSYAGLVSLDPPDRPAAASMLDLARLHQALPVGAPLDAAVIDGVAVTAGIPRADVAEGSGFAPAGDAFVRADTLPDIVAGGLRLLVIGLNPSPAASRAGIGFHRAGNRFWPAALAAGLVSRDRDPHHALTVHAVGFTDIVKRTTRAAAELSSAEYAAGMARLERLATWLAPDACVMVGLAGWRAAVDRRAVAGWQDAPLGPSPLYLMPSTSGLNARCSLGELTAHLRRAAGGPGPSPR
jgi:TDG/mug DNA glycosylase family protein